jgi:hypothetical protein
LMFCRQMTEEAIEGGKMICNHVGEALKDICVLDKSAAVDKSGRVTMLLRSTYRAPVEGEGAEGDSDSDSDSDDDDDGEDADEAEEEEGFVPLLPSHRHHSTFDDAAVRDVVTIDHTASLAGAHTTLYGCRECWFVNLSERSSLSPGKGLHHQRSSSLCD